MKLAFQGINNHNGSDLDNDGMLDVVTTPYDAEVNLSLIGKGNGKHPEIFRLEKMFKVNVIGVCSSWLEQGRVKCLLECQNALGAYSEMETDLSDEARYSLPFIFEPSQKESAWDAWVRGEFKSEDWLENLFAHHEAKKIAARRSPAPLTVDIPPTNETIPPSDGEVAADEIHCAICSRQLTNPTSRRLQIGPECRKRLGIKGIALVLNDVISDELMEASKLYHEEQFRKWIIRACLTLDAPIPTKVLNWLGNEWFGYRKAPILFYLSADGQLSRLDTYNRKLRHKVITKETAETELDSHAIRIASEANGNGKRQLQMDKKLNTWLIEADGSKKAISCREICEQVSDGSIITRLRAGIDSGTDISTVELDD